MIRVLVADDVTMNLRLLRAVFARVCSSWRVTTVERTSLQHVNDLFTHIQLSKKRCRLRKQELRKHVQRWHVNSFVGKRRCVIPHH